MVKLSPADQIIIAAYFAAVLAVGFLSTRRKSDTAEFLLAGRSLTLPVFVMTLVSSWYGGILGVGEFSYLYGLSNWVTQGVPYYVFALVFAAFLAKRTRASGAFSIPDQLEEVYGRKTALLGSFLAFILTTPAPYMLMIAVLIQLVTGWGFLTCLALGTAGAAAYLISGGFRSDVNTDILEFFLMFLGVAVILPFAYAKFGGIEYLRAHLPPAHLTWHGGNSVQFILVWFFIALWTLVDPAFYQRCYAAKSGGVAQKGIYISVLFWFFFDAITVTAGLYGRAAMPSLEQPVMTYPLLAELTLPSGAKGIFYVGMLATIMSTLNTQMFLSATTLGRDILWRMRREPDDRNVTRYTRWGLLLTAALSAAMSYHIPSVIRLWYAVGTVIIPGLLVPLVTSYFRRLHVPGRFAFAAMLSGWLTSLAWLLAGWSRRFGSSDFYPLGIEPMYPGLFVSLCVWGLGRARQAKSLPK